MSSGELKEISNGTEEESNAETAHDRWLSKPSHSNVQSTAPFVRPHVKQEIAKQVIRCKLSKRKHLVLKEVIDTVYLDELFPTLLSMFQPQTVTYNGGIANVKEWKISCYLEVMDGGIPTTCPHVKLRELFAPLLAECNDLFLFWYQQQHACNGRSSSSQITRCKRLMTFVTRYTPAPGEQALLKASSCCGCTQTNLRCPGTHGAPFVITYLV